MTQIHHYAWLGAMAFIPALFLLLAGLGWRKLAKGLALSLGLPLVGAVVSALVALKLSHEFNSGGGSGEWRGLGELVIAVLTGGASFLILFVLTLLWQLRSKRMTRERAPRSGVLLGLGGLAVMLAAVSTGDIIIGFNPKLAPTERLIQQLGHGGAESPVEAELVRHGPEAVPVITAELHRHPYQKSSEDEIIDLISVSPLLRVLGRLGGAEATTEVRRWTAKAVPSHVRAVAIDVLATQGDRTVIPLVVEMLSKPADGDWQVQRPELFHALGVLKAGEQVGLMRSALVNGRTGGSAHIRPAVIALAAIDTDEAWALILELAANKDEFIAKEVVLALEKCPGSRTFAVLGKILDSPEPSRREAAFTALQRLEPRLLKNGPVWSWSEADAEKMRAALQKRASERQ